jgi:hypothetical protein
MHNCLVSILWWLLAPQFTGRKKLQNPILTACQKLLKWTKRRNGEFSIWQDTGNTKFYVVNFGEKIKYAKDGISFLFLSRKP